MVEYRPSAEFTWADIVTEPDDGLRREIIGGSLLVNPAPFIRHQHVAFELAARLRAAGPADRRLIVAPIDWRFDEKGCVGPDIVVVPRSVDIDGPIPATVVPDLIVEVFSSNAAMDRTVKRDLYERLGVPAYWMVDPGGPHRRPAIAALRLEDGRYVVEAEATGIEPFITELPFAVEVVPMELLG